MGWKEVLIAIWAILLFAMWQSWLQPNHLTRPLAPWQEMRCDYQGCQIVDKAQPFSWYNTGE